MVRILTEIEKARYRPWFDDALLDSILLEVCPPVWLPSQFIGITLRDTIYLRNYDINSLDDAATLGHELTHARQYRDGMTYAGYIWSCRNGYDNSPYEKEAYGIEALIREALNDKKNMEVDHGSNQ